MTDLVARIQGAYEREMALGREAVTAEDLPLSFEAITDRWLTAVLCGQAPGAAVTGHGLGPEDNGSSNRRRIHVDYNAAGRAANLPTALFCKASHGLVNRVTLGVCGAAESEVVFYNAIRPLLDIEAPRSFYARIDKETFNSMIMLKDLTGEAQAFCDHRTVMTRERAESQMRLLATVHGQAASNPALRSHLDGFLTFHDFFARTMAFGMKEGANAGFLAAEEVIPARLHRRHADFWPANLRAVEVLNDMPHTLVHGDVHLKNWYVAASGEMALSDWQCATRAHWARDLAYTISTALTVEDRRAWERDLVALYLDRLAQAGGNTLPFGQAFDAYRKQLAMAMTWWTVTLCPAPGMPDMQPRDVTLEFVHRIGTAMDDLDSLDA